MDDSSTSCGSPSTGYRLRFAIDMLLCLVVLSPGSARADTGIEFFEKKIRPVLVDHCYSCHSAEAAQKKKLRGGLYLDSRAGIRDGGDSGPAVVPGKPNEGTLLNALRHMGKLKMPPKGKLPENVLGDFEKWIAMGAPDPRDGSVAVSKSIDYKKGRQFWAFQPVKQPTPPQVADPLWAKTPVDRFVKAQLETKGLTSVPLAPPRALVRRIAIDLVGLPPTLEEVEAFAKDYQRNPETAVEKLVDRLLASRQFAERWGRHWLDVARYADSNGNASNFLYPYAWRYRDWVIDSYHSDKPFPQFVTEQLAGDLLPADSDEQYNRQALGTGYLAIGSKNTMLFGEEFTLEMISEQIDAIGRGFLGLSIACARCHDHKLDPISTADYYALAGILRSSSTRGGFQEQVEPSYSRRLSMFMPLNRDGRARAETIAKDREMVEYFVRRELFENARRQRDKLPPNARENDRKQSEGSMARLKAEMDKLMEKMMNRPVPELPTFAMGALDDTKPADIAIRLRGDEKMRGDLVPRGVLKVFAHSAPEIPKNQSGRLQLARWIAAVENPMTARVYVNRVWYHLFGRGIVATVDDFGEVGARPSHPELLDHLAESFVAEGWSSKKLIRRLILTRTYQLGSSHDAANLTKDPENEFLWRHSRSYLDAESFRDAILQASGRLDLKPGPNYHQPEMMQGDSESFKDKMLVPANEAVHRSVYLPIFREYLIDSMGLFDLPDPTFVNGSRNSTTVSTQSLYLMNSPWMVRETRTMAARLLATPTESRIARAYQLAFCRQPSAEELRRCETFVKTMTEQLAEKRSPEELPTAVWGALCQVLLASAEFRLVE